MKLNLGCGYNRQEGFVNVDASPACGPDEVVDLEAFPWPWPDNSAEVAVFHHSLEHMGGDPKVFLRLMQELYRVCAPGARVVIVVPHPRSDNFLGDPTHVRPITPQMLTLFDRELNDEWKAKGYSNTPLAHYLGVDFHVEKHHIVVNASYQRRMQAGELTADELSTMLRTQYNIADEIRIELSVRKPG
jgi:predicted SAM-dependent methyltransferase